MRFYPFVSTGNDPRKGWRIPLNEIKYNEQRDALRLNPQSGGLRGARLTSPQDLLTGYGYLPRQARQAHHGARYMDHEILTSFLSVDRYADKYPFISPYSYCAWNPIKLVDPTGDTIDIRGGAQAQADILSIVAPQYRDRITFQNDRVNVNVEGLSDEEIEADAGFSTIHNHNIVDTVYISDSTGHFLLKIEEQKLVKYHLAVYVPGCRAMVYHVNKAILTSSTDNTEKGEKERSVRYNNSECFYSNSNL